jgi:Fe-S-cluster containining protein
MSASPRPLPVIESCAGCGACCQVVTAPPFRRDLDGRGGEDTWERLRWERPDLVAEIQAAERARRASGRHDYGSPCIWYDAGTHLCRHYDDRPRACREFALGGVDCRDARRRARVD